MINWVGVRLYAYLCMYLLLTWLWSTTFFPCDYLVRGVCNTIAVDEPINMPTGRPTQWICYIIIIVIIIIYIYTYLLLCMCGLPPQSDASMLYLSDEHGMIHFIYYVLSTVALGQIESRYRKSPLFTISFAWSSSTTFYIARVIMVITSVSSIIAS